MDFSPPYKRATAIAPDSPQGTKPKFAKAEGKGTSLTSQNPPQQEVQQSQGSQDRTQRERDRGNGQGRRSDPWWRKDPNHMTPQELAEFKDLLGDLTRLVLPQADTCLTCSFRPKLPDGTAAPEWAMVSNLFTVAQAWNRKKSEEPDSLNMTLRMTLMHCLITTPVERVENAINPPTHHGTGRPGRYVRLPAVEPGRPKPTSARSRIPSRSPLPSST